MRGQSCGRGVGSTQRGLPFGTVGLGMTSVVNPDQTGRTTRGLLVYDWPGDCWSKTGPTTWAAGAVAGARVKHILGLKCGTVAAVDTNAAATSTLAEPHTVVLPHSHRTHFCTPCPTCPLTPVHTTQPHDAPVRTPLAGPGAAGAHAGRRVVLCVMYCVYVVSS